MLITTANYLQNIDVKKYFNPISTSIVLGANLLSDFKASFTDVFGGRSSTYEGKLNNIFEEAKEILIQKASKLNANGLIGFTVNYNELGGKDKAMLMITIYGTPVVVNTNIDNVEKSQELTINTEQFKAYLDAYNIVQNIDIEAKQIVLTKHEFNIISNSNLPIFLPIIDKINRVNSFTVDNGTNEIGNFKVLNQYFFYLDKSKSDQFLFEWLESSNPIHIKNRAYTLLLHKGDLNLNLIKDCILSTKSNIQIAYLINLAIESYKDYYTSEDLLAYQCIYQKTIEFLNSLKSETIIEKSFFNNSEYWICEICISKQEVFEKCSCGLNRYQMFNSQTPEVILKELNKRIIVLSELLKS